MGWKFDQPLYCLSDDKEQKEMIELWETEKHGGLSEGNNRLPMPLVLIMALIILTAFMITMPIWGQRPTANDFKDFVANMNSPEVQQIADPEKKIEYLYNLVYNKADGRLKGALERHPITWDDLLNIAPGVREIQNGGLYPLTWYNVIGDRIVLANFEGNYVEIAGKVVRERLQPWWDKGYTIDVFYVAYFIITIVIIIKQLPHFTRKPDIGRI